MHNCENCRREIRDGAKYCIYCGKLQTSDRYAFRQSGTLLKTNFNPAAAEQNAAASAAMPEQNVCEKCGRAIRPGAKFCIYCGELQNSDRYASRQSGTPLESDFIPAVTEQNTATYEIIPENIEIEVPVYVSDKQEADLPVIETKEIEIVDPIHEPEEQEDPLPVFEPEEVEAETQISEPEEQEEPLPIFEVEEVKVEMQIPEPEEQEEPLPVFEVEEVKVETQISEPEEQEEPLPVFEPEETEAETQISEPEEQEEPLPVFEPEETEAETQISEPEEQEEPLTVVEPEEPEEKPVPEPESKEEPLPEIRQNKSSDESGSEEKNNAFEQTVPVVMPQSAYGAIDPMFGEPPVMNFTKIQAGEPLQPVYYSPKKKKIFNFKKK